MKRFLKVYLAIVLLILLLANLILILLFARQFGYQAVIECIDCDTTAQDLTTALLVTNFTLAFLFAGIFIAVKHMVNRLQG